MQNLLGPKNDTSIKLGLEDKYNKRNMVMSHNFNNDAMATIYNGIIYFSSFFPLLGDLSRRLQAAYVVYLSI